MMKKNQLFYLMQMAGGTFPSGGFSQSWGLETYVEQGLVTNDGTFKEFTKSYLDSTIARCEGPLLCEAYRLSKDCWELDALLQLEELSCAIKVTKESRQSSIRMGKAFMRIIADILEDEELKQVKNICGVEGMSYPVIYGIVCGRLGLDLTDAVKAFVFSTVNALVQSAVKLVPLGNTQAQQVLMDLYPAMEQCAEESIHVLVEDISNFCPGMDIASIAHEFLPTRLYMS